MKLFRYLILNKYIKDPIVAIKVYQILYEKGQMPEILAPTHSSLPKVESKAVITEKPQNLQSTLEQLRSKALKTKKDKESIEILEAVIKNGY
jgi:hypothetical protein